MLLTNTWKSHLHAHTHTHTPSQTQTHTHTHRQSDTHTDNQTHTHTHIHQTHEFELFFHILLISMVVVLPSRRPFNQSRQKGYEHRILSW